MKGADVVMAGIVQYNDWLEEEVQNSSLSAVTYFTFASMKSSLGQEFLTEFRECFECP